MKPFPEDPKFTPGEKGFDDKDENGCPYDLLGRKPVGQRLTDLLDRVEQPLVIALDGGWGSGKSHFLKLWTGAHERELGGKAKVIYFDAFEHDYLDDPLISLVGALLKRAEKKSFPKTALAKIKSTGMRLAKPSLRIGLAVATAGASEMANAVWDEGLKAAEGIAADAIDEFWKKESGRTAAMQQFRDALTALTVSVKDGDPPQKIVFIIDELDRCRPDYALTLLEIVKHFFSVPNVHFVLGTNLIALENSVRTRYGIDVGASEYLMKFIHLRMAFPIVHDFQGNGAWAAYFDRIAADAGIGQQSTVCLRKVLAVYSRSTQVSLRDVQRLTGRVALFPKEVESYDSAYMNLAMSALVLQTLSPAHYARLRNGRLVINEIVQLFPDPISDERLLHFASILNHLWRRVLMDDPGEETKSFTASAFGPFGDRLGKDHFEKLWADLFDVFQLPTISPQENGRRA
jgi:KAP family P-loop domain